MGIENLVTAKAGSVVAENLKLSLATPAASLTPATLTAMIGISQGTALQLAQPVQDAMTKLSDIANSLNPANVQAASALSSLSSFQSILGFGGSPNHSAFGSFINQAQGHIQDSIALRQSSDFMANMKYSDFGAGITDLGSSVDRGLSSALGSLSDAGALMASTGTMFNGIDTKDFGSSLGTVKALLDNKLATVTGVRRRLAVAGVPIADLDNPIYKNKIDQVMSTITDPGALTVVADQFNVAPEIAATSSGNSTTDSIMSKLQNIIDRLTNYVTWIETEITAFQLAGSMVEYNTLKSQFFSSTEYQDYLQCFTEANSISKNEISPLPDNEFKLSLVNFRNNDVEAAMAEANSATAKFKAVANGIKAMLSSQEGLVTDATMTASATGPNTLTDISSGISVPSTAMGADLSPGTTLLSGAGGIQSLKDLGDPTKLNSEATAAVTGGVSGLVTQLTDLGAGFVKDASAAPGLFGMIQSVQTPINASDPIFSDLGSMIKNHQGIIDSMTGSGNGPLGLPNMTDFTQHLAGGPSITGFLQSVDSNPSTAISALTASISSAQSLWTTAGVDLTSPVSNSLGSAMAFAQNLHKFGADISGSGIADVLHNMANTATAYGESIKASLAEGKNAKLLSDNAIPPITTAPIPPTLDATIVNYPITISRDFPRPPGSITGSFITIEVIATSPTDVTWRLINGETTTVRGVAPYGVMYAGNYETLYAATKERLKDADPGIAPQAIVALPEMKSQLDMQISGKTPKALG